ncbi:uncharacterized protein L201_004514 [Kwoniella dendrophila CBS 6074]|uniref:GATA-type domain-containing protein n=1 Tax=Kwoniella dendrophila CBS 6074 TaxID=1295534 RepID=A0AAX4JXJ3_9TREE
MSSAPKAQTSHQHSASFTYGNSKTQAKFSSGLSQERSTASPTQAIESASNSNPTPIWPTKVSNIAPPPLQSNTISSPSAHVQVNPFSHVQFNNMQQTHYSPTQVLPQVQQHYAPSATNTSTSNTMLPPLRISNYNDPRINPPYASSAPPPLTGNHYGYSYGNMTQFTAYQRPTTYYPGGHVPQHSISSSTGSELLTPLSASSTGAYPFNSNDGSGSNGNTPTFGAQPPPQLQTTNLPQMSPPNTIQPSAFQSWQTTRLNGMNGQGTISPLGILGPESSARLIDRKSSTPGGQSITGVGNGDKWDRQNMGQSPEHSERLSSEDDVRPELNKNSSNADSDSNISGTITYTTDCEVKQSSEVKRMCFNCTNKSPPSWRKSLLHPGKILCNKCGIFERTHHKPRPPQNDDQKLRKQTPIPGSITTTSYRREVPSNLQVMRDDSDGSPVPPSPYSNVPSQATPVSATFSFPPNYHSPPDNIHSSNGMMGIGRYRRSMGLWNQTSPSQHALSTPISTSSTAIDGDQSMSPIRTGYHGHGSSPYAHAYANRRTYSQPVKMNPMLIPFSSGPSTPTTQFNQYNDNNFSSSASTGTGTGMWYRRHSDIQLLPSLSNSTNNSLSNAGSEPNSISNSQSINANYQDTTNHTDCDNENDTALNNDENGVKSEPT